MTTFLVGFLAAVLPGLVTGWLAAAIVGWFMHRDDYCRHPAPHPAPAQPVAALAERVDPPPAPVVNVYVAAPGLPWSQAYQAPAQTFPELERWTS